jgi:hypothetical protein
MKRAVLPLLVLAAALTASGCATYVRRGLDPDRALRVECSNVRRDFALSPETRKAILALDPEHVTEADIRGVLSLAPAPRIISIHGGIYPVHRRMISFSHFLIGMGYPASSITNPGDGTYTFSCYESSLKIAGVIAWYYEREGLRPMLFGHSQGGMQAIKVLHKLAGHSASELHVWNPLTWQREATCEITDPLTGRKRSVVGLTLPYAAVTGAGGLTRLLPNQWDMCVKLHKIPDSVEEFTGFCKGKDPLGGDYLGYGPANHYKAMDKAVVRNIWLPSSYKHREVPDTEHLLRSRQIMDWLNQYHPSEKPVDTPRADVEFDSDSRQIVFAAEVWYCIKKHWVLELQRRIRASQLAEAHP